MGIDIEGCAKKEDFTYEEETEADGREGIEGYNSIEQMPCMWAP